MEMNFSMIKARIAEADNVSDRRRSERVSIEVDAHVREMGNEGCEARILNISEHGFMAEVVAGDFEVGTRVWLILPGRERASAVVKWTAGGKMGCEFAEPVSLDQLSA
ncbi:PilZ domain-containing protein [Sphingomicrobium nitratireducens]|uniref:PilZ domain-containing protein n=1 Tax=Sphingomicrobium nitratireducens TaxID=2964666 RepID=UPI00223EBC7D|nr:PilZ domain-containing protein [Sphingomicrobium nitratireducens]